MRANIMSDVQCEQRGRSMGVSWSATLSVTDERRSGVVMMAIDSP